MHTGLSYREALELALENVPLLEVESIPLASALGRALADDFHAPFALPGFANAAMDGYAIRASDAIGASEHGLRLAATVFAGDTMQRGLDPGTAMAVMTGALMPENADTVVIRENTRVENDLVRFDGDVQPGANVRSADDDCATDDLIVPAGVIMDAHKLGILASFGFTHVQVRRRPRVSILVTGDELVHPGEALSPGLRYDSNGVQIAAAARISGADVVACEHCRDDTALLEKAIARLSASSDMLITTGGVSAGQADLLPGVISKMGEIAFWKVRIKPGMPVLFARIGECCVFALPGNAVSCGVVFHVLVRPVLDAMQGCAQEDALRLNAKLGSAWRKTHWRLEFLRVRLDGDACGGLVATPFHHQGSGALSVLARANALAVLDEGRRDYDVGDVVAVLPLPDVRFA